MRKYCVYCHEFPNGKKYIGITCRGVKARWCYRYKSQTKINNAIGKYGWDNVKHNIVAENLTEEQAKKMECDLIKKYDTYKNGYNATIGGDNIRTTYLNTNILNKIRCIKSCLDVSVWGKLPRYIYSMRMNSEVADFFNEADNAITQKHGNFSNRDEIQLAKYWFAMNEYIRLHVMIVEKGYEYAVKHYKERHIEDALAELIFKQMSEREE